MIFVCKKGHSLSITSRRKICRICQSEYCKKWRAKNKDYIKKSAKKYVLENIDKVKESRKKYYNENKHRFKLSKQIRWVKNRYGISGEKFIEMLRFQDDKCAICNKKMEHSRCVDHDHITGKVRALLCWHCNWLLGYSKDSPELLGKAIEYLHFHQRVG